MNKPKEFQTTTQIIAREGFKPVAGCIIVAFLCIFFHFEFFALFAFVCALFCAFIFRNSERIATYRGEDALIAPCDGIIKDISIRDSTTQILVKINIFDNGIFRVPARITHIKSAFKFGLFIKSDKNLQKILNTKHKVSGFWGNEAIFSITLLPEAWNKANIYELDSAPHAQKSQNNNMDCHDSTQDLGDSMQNAIQDSVFIGDRLGFMKYGYLLLEIYAPCKLLAQRGDNLFAGETLLGKLRRDSQAHSQANLNSDSKANLKATLPSKSQNPRKIGKILGGEQ